MFDDLPTADARYCSARRSISSRAAWRYSLGTLFIAITGFSIFMFAMRVSSRQVRTDLLMWLAAAVTAQAIVWIVARWWKRADVRLWGTVCVVGITVCTLLARVAGLSVTHPLANNASSVLMHYLAWMKIFGTAAALGLGIGWLASLGKRPRLPKPGA